MSYYQQKKGHRLTIGQDGNALTMLIAVTLIAFVLLAFIKVIYFLHLGRIPGMAAYTDNFFKWVTLPADGSTLATRPWTVLTHMLVHDTSNVWHIVGNLIWMWAFGYILQEMVGNRRVIPVFIYGALAGALGFLLSMNFIPQLHSSLPTAQLYGASAGVMAIAIATTTAAPNYRIFTMLNGGIPIWIVTVLYVILNLAMAPDSNGGTMIAHATGGLMGFAFMAMLQRGRDLGSWMNNLNDWFVNLFNPDRPSQGKTVKSQLFYKSRVQPYTKTPLLTQQKIDEILDKINQRGYHSLSEDEKEVLKRAAKEDLL